MRCNLTLLVPSPDEEKKLGEMFIFTLLCGASTSFTKTLKTFIKPFETPQKSVKIKISPIFFSSEMHGTGRVKVLFQLSIFFNRSNSGTFFVFIFFNKEEKCINLWVLWIFVTTVIKFYFNSLPTDCFGNKLIFSYEIKISLLQKEPIAGVLDKKDVKILETPKTTLELQFFMDNLQSESSKKIFQEHIYPAKKQMLKIKSNTWKK